MSILAEVTPGAAELDTTALAVLAVWGAIALVLILLSGVLRRRSVVGPPRWGEEESAGTIFKLTMVGVFAWMSVPIFFAAGREQTPMPTASSSSVQSSTSQPASAASPASLPTTIQSATTQIATTQPVSQKLSPAQIVRIASTGAAVAFVTLLIANLLTRQDALRRLGLDGERFLRAIPIAVLGMAIVIPLMAWAGVLTQLLWQMLGIEHPNEHEMLRMLGETENSGLRRWIIVSAVLLAPLSEELLFRGHVQTMFTMLFTGAARRESSANVMPQQTEIEHASPVAAPTRYPALARWLAILFTSALFASIHPWWTIPPILFLAIILGYVYERTANLWAVILIHAMFNASSVLYYLHAVTHT